MWMGTHPSGPSMVVFETPWQMVTPLSEWIKLNAEVYKAGSALVQRQRERDGSLPFLFKILSVRTALSIQAHPDRALAAQLHHAKPDKYKDDNHKPEMAVAITPFEAMCSFQPGHQIINNLHATPELMAVVGRPAVAELEAARDGSGTFKKALKTLFEALMNAPKELIASQLGTLMARIESTSNILRSKVDSLACRLHDQYPGDVGVFCVYLLNYTVLQPGDALFLAANEPHAYISGDCAEIMATSDNVVRAGLTPKWMDIDTLCSCLTYNDGDPHYVEAEKDADQNVWRYCPPIDEFMLERVELADGEQATLGSKEDLSIIIIVTGEATIEQLADDANPYVGLQSRFQPGAVQLVCPRTALRVHANGKTLLFRASAQDGYASKKANTPSSCLPCRVPA